MVSIGNLRALLMTGTLMLGLSGCMIPVYHQPQGFSSTYFRHLQQTAPVMTGAHATPAELAKTPEKKDEVSEAEPLDEDNEESASVTEKSGSWWSWIRRPISFRPNAESEADEEEAAEADEASAPRLDRR